MINQFYIDYIKAIENPDRVGWNGKVWTAPQYKGYDKNQRGYGIDIVKNDSAKRLTQNRPGQWLTEGEADKLMKEHLLYVYGAAQKHIEGFDNLSDRRKAALLGMLYRGDSVNKNRHIININEPDDNKFFESISNYYKSKGLNERARNSSNFFNNQTNFLIPMKWKQWEPPMKFKNGGQVRKMQTASGGPIINGGTPFSITVKGKDRRPAWKRMYLNPNLGDTSKYYNGNILEGVIGLAPGIGDAIDAVKAADAVNNKDYTTAGFLGAGLLLPNIIEKPFKFVRGLYKGHKANKIMEAARKAFDESGEKLEVDAFKSGSKPMYVTPAKGPGSNHIDVISDELKDSKYLDLERPFGKDGTLTLRYYINEDKLKQIIGTYKDLYKDRLGLYTNDVDKIYNHIISNPKLLDLNVNPGTSGLLDIIGVSLGYGPKDAILFKIGYNGLNTGEKVSKDAIESMKTYGYDRTLPGIYNILKKNIERGTLGVKSTNTNGGHVGFGYIKNKLGGMLQLLKNGSGIHIKEKNKGKFTSYCGGKVTDECILKGKNSSNPAIRKRATFAANARKWKHKEGGIIKGLFGLGDSFWNFLYRTGIGSKGDFKRMKLDLVNLGILQDNSENPNLLMGAPTILPGTRMDNVILMEKEAPTIFKMISENPEKMKELLKEYKELYKYRGGSNESVVKPFNGLARKIKTFLNTGDKNLLKEIEDWAKKNKYIFVNKKEAEVTPKGFLTAPDREKSIDYMSREVQAKPMSDKLWNIITPEGWNGYIDRIITTSYKRGGIIKASNGTKTNFFLKTGNWISNNKDLANSIANAGLGIISNIKLNKAINAQIEANEKLMEVNKQQAFMDNYIKALGMLSDRSDIVNRNKAWLIANNLNYSDDELENENLLLKQSKIGILDSLGGLSTDILNAFSNNKKDTSTSSNNSTFGNYVSTLFKNYGTFNSDGSMNMGQLGTWDINSGYKPKKIGTFMNNYT